MLLNSLKVCILEEFVRDYKIRLTGSSIARKKKLNQKSVSNSLKQLETSGFLKSITQGKNKLYTFNLDNKGSLLHFISVIEHLRAIAFYKKQPIVKEIIEKILPYCKGIVVIFGSYAKGLQKKDSDLDLFIVGDYNSEEIEKISRMYRIDINIKHYSRNIFRNALKKTDFLMEEVIKNHILVSNNEAFVSCLMELKYGNN